MSRENVLKIFKRYQKAGRNSKARRAYFRVFEPKMIYRTTKTENPETTEYMVQSVLRGS